MRNHLKKLLAVAVLMFAASAAYAGQSSNVGLGLGNLFPAITTGINNIVVGQVSSALTTGSNNVLLGTTAGCDVSAATTSNSLVVCNSGTNMLSAQSTNTTLPSLAASGNPLQMGTVQNITLASVNTSGGYTFLPGVPGRTITPTGLTVMASGTAAGATAVFFQCTSGNILGSFPIAALVTQTPVTPFSSTGTGAPSASCTPASKCLAFAQGCAAGDGVLVSVNGSALTTTTNLFVNMPFIVQ